MWISIDEEDAKVGRRKEYHTINVEMDNGSIIRAYKRYAPYYDHIFGRILNRGRRLVIEKMSCRPGDRILEVGVGTGLSLSLYPDFTHVVAIDICPEMIARSASRIVRDNIANVSLALMDAQDLTFKDHSFDKVAAMYVVSVVPDPVKLMSEIWRICKPCGDIYLLNHFTNSRPVLRAAEALVLPLSKVIGFRPMFEMDDLISANSLRVVETKSVNLFGYWTLVHMKNGS